MKKLLLAFAASLALFAGAFGYRTIHTCADWRNDYNRYTFIHTMRTGPMLETEELFSERPAGCEKPTLTEADKERFRSDGVDPEEFLAKLRASR